ncbi:hypothetical protein HK097_003245, partial [Rhizophlyctis rosea]
GKEEVVLPVPAQLPRRPSVAAEEVEVFEAGPRVRRGETKIRRRRGYMSSAEDVEGFFEHGADDDTTEAVKEESNPSLPLLVSTTPPSPSTSNLVTPEYTTSNPQTSSVSLPLPDHQVRPPPPPSFQPMDPTARYHHPYPYQHHQYPQYQHYDPHHHQQLPYQYQYAYHYQQQQQPVYLSRERGGGMGRPYSQSSRDLTLGGGEGYERGWQGQYSMPLQHQQQQQYQASVLPVQQHPQQQYQPPPVPVRPGTDDVMMEQEQSQQSQPENEGSDTMYQPFYKWGELDLRNAKEEGKNGKGGGEGRQVPRLSLHLDEGKPFLL